MAFKLRFLLLPWLLLFTLPGCAQSNPAAEARWEQMVDAGNAASDQGDYVTAEKAFRGSLAFATEQKLDNTYLGGSNDAIAFVLRMQRRYSEAEPLYRTALRRTMYPEDHPRVVQSKLGLGLTLVGLQRTGEAEALLLEVLRTAEQKQEVQACDLILPLDALTTLYRSTHQYAKGERVFIDTFALLAQNQSTPCEGYIGLLDDLGALYTEANQWDKVDKINDSRVQLALGMEGPASELYAYSLRQKGDSLYARKRYAQAASAYEESVAAYKRVQPPMYDDLAAALEGLYNGLYQSGRSGEALAVKQELKATLERSRASDPRAAMLAARERAFEAQKADRPAEADRYLAQAMNAAQRLSPADQMAVYQTAHAVHVLQQKLAEAEADMKRVLELAIASTGEKSRATANAHYELGFFYLGRQRMSEAEQELAAAVAIYDDRDVEQLKPAMDQLIGAYLKENRYEQALPLLDRAARLAEATHDNFALSRALNQLADTQRRAGHDADAESTFLRSMTLADALPRPYRMQWAEGAMNLAALYANSNRAPQAEQLYLKVLAFLQEMGGPNSPAQRIPLEKLIALARSQGRLSDATKYEAQRDRLPAMPRLPGQQ